MMHFFLRVCSEQLSALHRAPYSTQPDKAGRLGYKAYQGYVMMYRICVLYGSYKCPVPKDAI